MLPRLVPSVVAEIFRFLSALNMAKGIDGFLWSLLDTKSGMYQPSLVAAVIEVILLVVSGAGYFRRTEQTFAHVI